MDFGQIMFLYGSPALAVITFVLNLTEIILLSKRCCSNNRARRCQRRPVPIIFMMNLAISDLFVGLTVIVVKIVYYLFLAKILPVTKLNLRIYHVLMFVFLRISLLCSVFNLMALTLDRFLAINNPMKYRVAVRKKQALAVSALAWILSSALVTAHYYISFYTSVKPWEYEMVIFPAAIIPSSIVFSVCYICILRKIKRQGKEMKRLTDSGDNRVAAHVLRRESQVAKLAATVVCIFMVCWLPVAIVGLVQLSGKYVEPVIVNPVFVLAFANSALDPLVYFWFKEALGSKLQKLWGMIRRCGCWHCIRTPSASSSMPKSTDLFGLSSVMGGSINSQVVSSTAQHVNSTTLFVNNSARNEAIELDEINEA